jgi:SAM-dependent methyltransferase
VIARYFPVTDHKSRESRWDFYYDNFDMEQYLSLLEYDEVTTFIDRHMNGLDEEVRVLDVGCGPGRHLIHLCRKGFRNLWGIDLSSNAIETLKDFQPEIDARVGDATDLSCFSDGSFDVVVMVGVVYEIADCTKHSKVFSEIARVLVKGGLLLFVNNSPYNLGEKIFTVCQRLTSKDVERRFFVWRYERKDVVKHLEENGFELLEEWPGNQYRGPYRFCYGIFVRKAIRKERTERLEKENVNPYSLHEHYRVNRDHSLLNPLGRLVGALTTSTVPSLFANSVGYSCRKKAEGVRSGSG